MHQTGVPRIPIQGEDCRLGRRSVPVLRSSKIKVASLAILVLSFGITANAQQSSTQDIPDAPSASKPPAQFPTAPPPQTGMPEPTPEEAPAPEANTAPRSDSG